MCNHDSSLCLECFQLKDPYVHHPKSSIAACLILLLLLGNRKLQNWGQGGRFSLLLSHALILSFLPDSSSQAGGAGAVHVQVHFETSGGKFPLLYCFLQCRQIASALLPTQIDTKLYTAASVRTQNLSLQTMGLPQDKQEGYWRGNPLTQIAVLVAAQCLLLECYCLVQEIC